MDFLAYISTPKNTLEIPGQILKLHLTRGRLTGGFLYFPSGPAGTLHFLARIAGHQIIPFSPGESYRLDDCVIPFSLGIDLLEPPFFVDCVTWNDSNSHAHVLTVCFFVSPSDKKRSIIKRIKNPFSGTDGYQKS